MPKEEWMKVVKWMGYVYLPIALLFLAIFILVEWNISHIDKEKANLSVVGSASSTPKE